MNTSEEEDAPISDSFDSLRYIDEVDKRLWLRCLAKANESNFQSEESDEDHSAEIETPMEAPRDASNFMDEDGVDLILPQGKEGDLSQEKEIDSIKREDHSTMEETNGGNEVPFELMRDVQVALPLQETTNTFSAKQSTSIQREKRQEEMAGAQSLAQELPPPQRQKNRITSGLMEEQEANNSDPEEESEEVDDEEEFNNENRTIILKRPKLEPVDDEPIEKSNAELLYERIEGLRTMDYYNQLAVTVKLYLRKFQGRERRFSNTLIVNKLVELAVKKLKTTKLKDIVEIFQDNLPGNNGQPIPVYLSILNNVGNVEERKTVEKRAKELMQFKYIDKNILKTPLPQFIANAANSPIISCNCEDNTCKVTCSCVKASIKRGKMMINDGYVYLAENLNINSACAILCGEKCTCKGNCSNGYNKVFKELDIQLNMHNSEMGFVIEAAKSQVQAGQLVFPYLGEITDENLCNNYNFSTYEVAKDKFIKDLFQHLTKKATWNKKDIQCDPKAYGNVARFASTTEQPNLVPIRLIVNDLRPEAHILGFYAIESVPPGGELQVYYGTTYSLERCLCEMPLCPQSRENVFLGVDNQKEILSLLEEARQRKVKVFNMRNLEKEAVLQKSPEDFEDFARKFRVLVNRNYGIAKNKRKKELYSLMWDPKFELDFKEKGLYPNEPTAERKTPNRRAKPN